MPTPTELGLLDAIADLQTRLDAPTREEYAIAGEILSPSEYQALLEMDENEQAEYIAMLVELFREQTPRKYRQYNGILEAQPVEEDQQDLLSGSLALGVLGAVWLWDRQQQRYFKPKGKTQGKTLEQVRQTAIVVEPPTVEELLQAHIAIAQDDLTRMTDDLLKGRETLEDWQLAIAERLRDLYYQSAMLAVGGKEGLMQTGVRTDLIAAIQRQYDYLRGFAMEIELGSQSPAQIRSRIKLYAKAGNAIYKEFQALQHEESGFLFAARKLGQAHQHCDDCVMYARRGVQPIWSLPAPTQQCVCGNNCVCKIKYGRTEDELERWLNKSR